MADVNKAIPRFYWRKAAYLHDELSLTALDDHIVAGF
jgi:hypothetical protein